MTTMVVAAPAAKAATTATIQGHLFGDSGDGVITWLVVGSNAADMSGTNFGVLEVRRRCLLSPEVDGGGAEHGAVTPSVALDGQAVPNRVRRLR
jgi:hypothetical protein